jgi:two-component system phosphate regulon sensor histidine kinase PhoR
LFLTNNSSYQIPSIIFVLVLLFYFIYAIGDKRKNQIRRIQKAIDGIRNNQYNSAHEIQLGNQLKELEEDIKSMFLKTRNDIENMKKLELVRTEFLGNVSHELRTPIFAIQGFLETLLNGAVDDPKVNRVFIDKAYKQSQGLNNLLHDLIDISMIEAGQMKMSFRYFLIGEYLQNIVNEFLPIAEEKGLGIHLINENPKMKLYGDKDRLRQVIVNLISNSIKYTENGSIEIIVKDHDTSGEIIVKDTGIGIPKEDLPRIFERFYRVDKVRSRAMGGTGLGLAIVKHILDAHGTKIKVKSESNAGAEFAFRLKK